MTNYSHFFTRTCCLRVSFAAIILLLTAPSQLLANGQLDGEGKWASSTSEMVSGAWILDATVEASAVDGVLTLKGSPTLSGSLVEGTIDGQSIVFGTISRDSHSLKFTGTLHGRLVSGTWESDSLRDYGTWEGTFNALDGDTEP